LLARFSNFYPEGNPTLFTNSKKGFTLESNIKNCVSNRVVSFGREKW
jgi:hypothetical protein